MSKILILPDIHGRDFWKEPCSHIDEFDKVIFLGDYHDPYPNQVSIDESRDNMKCLVEFICANQNKVICLLGNHDYSYITGYTPCRFDSTFKENIKEYLDIMDLKVAYKIDNYLFTHSGVLKPWLDEYDLTIEELFTLNINHYSLKDISSYRGGYSLGSCIWGDLIEFTSYQHYNDDDYYQIFGHTQLRTNDGFIQEDFACLDSRCAFVLDTETKELVKYERYICR